MEGMLGGTLRHHTPPTRGERWRGAWKALPGTIHPLQEGRGGAELGRHSRARALSTLYRRVEAEGRLGGTLRNHPPPTRGERWRGAWKALPGTIHPLQEGRGGAELGRHSRARALSTLYRRVEAEGRLGGTLRNHPPPTRGERWRGA